MPKIAHMPNPTAMQTLFALRDALQSCAHGGRAALVAAHAQAHGIKANAVYKQLKQWTGWDSGRKTRADAGVSSMDNDALVMLGSMKAEGVRLNGKATMPTTVAAEILHENGINMPVGVSQINRLLRANKLDKASQDAARTFTTQRSLHPNHVHLVDPSLCLLYYTAQGKQAIKKLKQVAIRDDELYKNKLGKLDKVQFKVWRYVRVDHASGVIDVLYIQAAGESQANMYEFLNHSWRKQARRVNYGVPAMVGMDKGSANTAGTLVKWLHAMGVETFTHAAGHAWAKGAVEVANNIVETQFESRLKIEPVNNVDELNAACQHWLAAYNGNLLRYADTRIKRPGCDPVSRDVLWLKIQAEQLIELPARALCDWFMTGKTETRKVDSHMRISFKHPCATRSTVYDLAPWASQLCSGEVVTVEPLLMGDDLSVRISVQRGALAAQQGALVFNVCPVSEYDEYGRPMSAAVIGQEFKRNADTPAMVAQKAMQVAAWGTSNEADVDKKRRASARPFERVDPETGEIKALVAHSHIEQVRADNKVVPLPRKAVPMDNMAVNQALAAQSAQVVMLTVVEAAKAMRVQMVDAGMEYSADVYSWLVATFGDAVPEATMDTLVAQYMQHVERVQQQVMAQQSKPRFAIAA